eukprot:CAMPEP_0181070906 /NCGR_PEP_ID=MMETSP1070-20121207/27735_1 /TAXON_ID=265543 /ORGANISM="Minutocellus polymorphus, Strain NH13" /LENGTH=233 /DNA_ID=CAMNT_0023151821 /DNA_START=139 /DNA_END=836 /DNA_ORIENTATION=-
MYQSFRLSGQNQEHQPAPAKESRRRSLQTARPILGQYISSTDGKICAPSDKSVDDIVSDLQQLRRSEFLELWMGCEAPPQNMKSVDGDWNGVLLDNNGILMTKVSEFLTDALFGRKFGKWNGKAFHAGENGGGVNRFFSRSNDADSATIQYEHKFDCRVEASQLDRNGESLVLRYANYQNRLSPWHTMRDEIRVLPVKGRKNGGILLGLGCMRWSGAYVRDGMLNSAPFCLYR